MQLFFKLILQEPSTLQVSTAIVVVDIRIEPRPSTYVVQTLSAVQWVTMAGTAAPIGLLLLPFLLCQEVKDASRVISVAWTNNSFQVLPGMCYVGLSTKSQN